jgi:hypothetical protein
MGVFEGLQSLQELEAQNNMITSIAENVFQHTPLLQKLYVWLVCTFLMLTSLLPINEHWLPLKWFQPSQSQQADKPAGSLVQLRSPAHIPVHRGQQHHFIATKASGY